MTPDRELLQRYARDPFRRGLCGIGATTRQSRLFRRARQVNGDARLAQDVAQKVFTDLARKAALLAHREGMTGWLYTSTHFAAAKMVRDGKSPPDREEKFMREPICEPAPEPEWQKLRPLLDKAMHELKAADREAVLLRYFENRPLAEVGVKLGLNENAARLCEWNAPWKSSGRFSCDGASGGHRDAGLVISANAVQIAPAGLATTLTTASLAGAGIGTFTLLKFMTLTNLKLGLGALVVAGATTALVIQHQTQEKLRTENSRSQQQVAQLKTDNESLSNRPTIVVDSKSPPNGQLDELLRLRGEVGVLRRQTNELRNLLDQDAEFATAGFKFSGGTATDAAHAPRLSENRRRRDEEHLRSLGTW